MNLWMWDSCLPIAISLQYWLWRYWLCRLPCFYTRYRVMLWFITAHAACMPMVSAVLRINLRRIARSMVGLDGLRHMVVVAVVLSQWRPSLGQDLVDCTFRSDATPPCHRRVRCPSSVPFCSGLAGEHEPASFRIMKKLLIAEYWKLWDP